MSLHLEDAFGTFGSKHDVDADVVVSTARSEEHSTGTEGGAEHLSLSRSDLLVKLVRFWEELGSAARFRDVFPERDGTI